MSAVEDAMKRMIGKYNLTVDSAPCEICCAMNGIDIRKEGSDYPRIRGAGINSFCYFLNSH